MGEIFLKCVFGLKYLFSKEYLMLFGHFYKVLSDFNKSCQVIKTHPRYQYHVDFNTPRRKFLHEVMNFHGLFMNVHENVWTVHALFIKNFAACSWTSFHELFIKLFMSCSWNFDESKLS